MWSKATEDGYGNDSVNGNDSVSGNDSVNGSVRNTLGGLYDER